MQHFHKIGNNLFELTLEFFDHHMCGVTKILRAVSKIGNGTVEFTQASFNA